MSAEYVLVSRNEPLYEAQKYSHEPSNPPEPRHLEMVVTSHVTISGSPTAKTVLSNEKPHICFFILGPTGSGNSSFIAAAAILPENASIIGHSLDSHTSTCTPYLFETTSTRFTLLNTPGFDDPSRDGLEILASISAFLSSPAAPRIAGILLTHNITVNRLTGSARQNQAIVRALCGEPFAPRLVLLTTMWNQIPSPAVHAECQRREAQLLAAASSSSVHGGYGGALRFDGTRAVAEWVLAEMVRTLPAADTAAPQAQIVAEMAAGTPLAQTRAGRVILDERERREKQREGEYREELEEERERLRAKQAERARLTRQVGGGGGHHRGGSSRTRRDGGFAGAPCEPTGAVDWQYQAEVRMAYGNSRHDEQQGHGGLPPVLPFDTSSRPTQKPWAHSIPSAPPSAHPVTALASQVDPGVDRQTDGFLLL